MLLVPSGHVALLSYAVALMGCTCIPCVSWQWPPDEAEDLVCVLGQHAPTCVAGMCCALNICFLQTYIWLQGNNHVMF
jgi:hypothetical protein